MVRRPADAFGMTVVSLAISAPLLLALWLALSGPPYDWIATILPLVIALGAPIAFVVTGFAGPMLGRQVSAFFSRSVKITPAPATLESGTSAPKVLVYASDSVAVRVQEVLSHTCDVTVAATSAQAILSLQRDAPRKVFLSFDTSMNIKGLQEVLEAALATVGHQQMYFLLSSDHGIDAWRKRMKEFRFVEPRELEALAAEFRAEGADDA